MNTILKKTDINILKYLNHNNNISTKDIAAAIKKSETSIRNSIKNINNFLEENNLSPLEKINGKYTLSNFTSNDLNKFLIGDFVELPPNERFNYLILELILTEKLNLNEKAKLFNVTRKTLSLDLEEVKKFLCEKNLSLESIPWKGIYLQGNTNDKIQLAIKFIMKLLLEREFNQFTVEVHKKFLNPLLDKLYHQYIPVDIEQKLYILTKNTLNHFDIQGGTHLFNSFLAASIYCYLQNEHKLVINSKKTIFSKEVEIIHKEYMEYFQSEFFKNQYPFLKNNNVILANALTRMHPAFLKNSIDSNKFTIDLFKSIEKYFNFEFINDIKIKFIQLLGVAEFKFIYRIKRYNSCFSEISQGDKEIIMKIGSIFNHYNVFIYEEDLTLLALLIKENLMIYEKKQMRKILVLDCFYESWLGNMIKVQLQNNFLNLNIIVKSFYNIEKQDILDLNPDLIIYTNFEFDNFFTDINITKQQLTHANVFKYMEYFENLGLFRKDFNETEKRN
ncbi:helix-turn-helix domain-containing protein [Cetobacterium sp. SF1]|uniref:helix-turn-helix domain-containing protein n=1 Tax=Cetobacterium sp. SF1 TaxID=3417654 RepID=UPI003CE80354